VSMVVEGTRHGVPGVFYRGDCAMETWCPWRLRERGMESLGFFSVETGQLRHGVHGG